MYLLKKSIFIVTIFSNNSKNILQGQQAKGLLMHNFFHHSFLAILFCMMPLHGINHLEPIFNIANELYKSKALQDFCTKIYADRIVVASAATLYLIELTKTTRLVGKKKPCEEDIKALLRTIRQDSSTNFTLTCQEKWNCHLSTLGWATVIFPALCCLASTFTTLADSMKWKSSTAYASVFGIRKLATLYLAYYCASYMYEPQNLLLRFGYNISKDNMPKDSSTNASVDIKPPYSNELLIVTGIGLALATGISLFTLSVHT